MKMNIFKRTDKDKEKNKKLTGDVIRVRVNRLINNTAVEIAAIDAVLTRDENNNTIIFDEENNIKEEIPGLYDSLVSDVLYKLESRGLSVEEQVRRVKEHIKRQENLINQEKNGYVNKRSEDGTEEKVKVNLQTEKSKLRLLKCVKYTLENKKGEGFYESIELDGTRSLTYLIRDGELIPYWHKTPTGDGEPIILVPDIVQRKKFWKEATDETINDFNESQDQMWKGILGFLTKLLFVAAFAGLIVWTVHNAKWASELEDKSLQPEIDRLKLQNEQIRQICSSQIANQLENNDALIDYAKKKLVEDQSKDSNLQSAKGNIQI